MTAEQEAIERLRKQASWFEEAKVTGGIGTKLAIVNTADLRALLDSHERMRAALEQLQRAVQRVCEHGLVEEAGLWLLDEALEGKNE